MYPPTPKIINHLISLRPVKNFKTLSGIFNAQNLIQNYELKKVTHMESDQLLMAQMMRVHFKYRLL